MSYYTEVAKSARLSTELLSGQRATFSVLSSVAFAAVRHFVAEPQGWIIWLLFIGACAFGVYALACGVQFAWQFIKAFGVDQSQKKTDVGELQDHVRSLLNPTLPLKHQQAIKTIERWIEQADQLFNRPPIDSDDLQGWANQVKYGLARLIGQASDEYAEFADIEQNGHPAPVENFAQTIFLRRVRILSKVIEDIKHQRILILNSNITFR